MVNSNEFQDHCVNASCGWLNLTGIARHVPGLVQRKGFDYMIKKLAAATGVAASLAAVSIAIAQAAPNSHGTDNANDHAQERGISVAGVAGNGPAAVIGAVQGFAPEAAQNGLANAASHVPTAPTTTTEAAAP